MFTVFTIQFTKPYIFRPKVTEPTGIKNCKARHTSKKCVMLPTSNTAHGDTNTKQTKKTKKPLYGSSTDYSENTFSCSSFPPPYPLSFCWIEGFWRRLMIWKQKPPTQNFCRKAEKALSICACSSDLLLQWGLRAFYWECLNGKESV